MRVLFLIHELALNGAVIALLHHARRMVAKGDMVTIATPQLSGAKAVLMPQFIESGARMVRTVPWREHDITVGCTVYAADVMRNYVGQTPTALWVHEGRSGVTSVMASNDARRVFQTVNKLIFPSRGVVERLWGMLVASLPPGRVEIIPCVIRPPLTIDPMPKPTGHARVICVGSIYPRKRQTDLLRAMQMLRGTPVECVLIGEVVMMEPPAEEIVRSDPKKFILTGGQTPNEVQAWYRSGNVFSLPSEDESMPIAPIEAAAQNLPVVLTDLECYEGVWRHGVNALIHPVGDHEMLAWYLKMLIESPNVHRRLAESGRAVALRFSEQRIGAMFDAALVEAIASFR